MEILKYGSMEICGAIKWERETEQRLRDSKCLEQHGYKVYSQNDEDGIISEIFKRIGTKTKRFIEFGVQDGLESNSHYLLHCGWTGMWIEGDEEYCIKIENIFYPVISNNKLFLKNAFITKDNIEELISDYFMKISSEDELEGAVDFLSIDVDGNDYYIWEAISNIRPRLVCIEYNGKFPPDHIWIQAYDENHTWDGSDWHGSSLKALELLGREKKYILVGTNIRGVNAFFVREDLIGDNFSCPYTAEHFFNPLRLRMVFMAGNPSRYCLVDQKPNIGVLNYKKPVDYNLGDYIFFFNSNKQEGYNADKYVISGISLCEGDFSWTDDISLKLMIRIQEIDFKKKVKVDVDVLGSIDDNQILKCKMGKDIQGEYRILSPGVYTFEVLLPEEEIVILEMLLPNAISPKELGLSLDMRKLGLRMKTICIKEEVRYENKIEHEEK